MKKIELYDIYKLYLLRYVFYKIIYLLLLYTIYVLCYVYIISYDDEYLYLYFFYVMDSQLEQVPCGTI